MNKQQSQNSKTFQQGVLLFKNGKTEETHEVFEKIISENPNHIGCLNLLGIIAVQAKKPQLAIAHLDRVIKLKPDDAAAYSNRGVALQDLKQMVEAVASYDHALAINPFYVEAWANRGNALLALNRLEEALINYDRAILVDPFYAEAFYNRSIALMQLGRIAESLANCDQAIAINPNYAEAYANRSVALLDSKRPSEALASCDLAIAHRPNFAEAHYNRGVALKELNCLAEAVSSFDRAIALQVNYPEAYLNKAISLLLAGDLNGGWDLYEWRWKQANVPKINVVGLKPLWHGYEDISNKTILLCAEQGFGDIIQFCRYATEVQQLGGRVILEVPGALKRLLAELKGVDFLVKKGDPLPHFDYYCPLLSLPKAFKTQLHTIPSPSPYLFVAQEQREEWIKKLGKKMQLRVGLVWSGSAKNTNDHNRSIPLGQLLPYLPAEHEYYCLQKEIKAGDEPDLARSHIRRYLEQAHDFLDTAALCVLMDVVISVDTSVAHLSAALGRNTYILLPFAPHWPWMLEREDSPWYASVKLLRQGSDYRWENVLQQLKLDLSKMIYTLME